MDSFGAPPREGGTHYFGHAYYPNMGWSEGWASWVSAETRASPLHHEVMHGFVFAFDLSRRSSTRYLWPRPNAADDLFQRIYDLEVAAMLWELGNNPKVTSARMYRGLASPRAKEPLRGYTQHTWDLLDDGEPTNVQDTGEPTVMLADFLDALVCSGDPADMATHIDAVTQPATSYPYPSQQPICQ